MEKINFFRGLQGKNRLTYQGEPYMKHLLFGKKPHVLFVLLFLFVCLLFFARVFLPISVSTANANAYLQVRSANFTVENVNDFSKYYQLLITTDVNLPHDAGSYGRYGLVDENDDEFTVYDQNGSALRLHYVSANDSRTSLLLVFHKSSSGDKIGYGNSVEKLIIPKQSKLLAPSDYTNGDYCGIEFAESVTFVREGSTWRIEEVASTPEVTNYEITLSKETVSVSKDVANNRLSVALVAPFSAETDVEYASTLGAYVNDSPCAVQAIQNANQTTIQLFVNANVENAEEIPSLRLCGGELTSASGEVTITCVGEPVFYEYVDGTWDVEAYVCVQETTNGQAVAKKIPRNGTYTFSAPEEQAEGLYIGWKCNGELYDEGDTIALAEVEKRTLAVESVFIDCELVQGASIRYDANGDSSGIRFISHLKKADLQAHGSLIAGVGIILMPRNLLGSAEFTWENYNSDGYARKAFVTTQDVLASEGEIFTLYATIVKVLAINYNREFLARAFVLVNDGAQEKYVWDSYICSRSVYYVATTALNTDKQTPTLKGWQKTILSNYVDGVANIAFDGESSTVVSATNTNVIESVQTQIVGEKIILRLTTLQERFSAITYNGMRVKGATQTYVNGVLTVVFKESNLEKFEQ